LLVQATLQKIPAFNKLSERVSACRQIGVFYIGFIFTKLVT